MTKRLLIIGSGDGGVMLANRLAKKGFDITVVDKSSTHYFQPWLLHIAFKGASEKSIAQTKLLPKGVKFVLDTVKEVDLAERSATLGNAKLEYDYVVVDTGSTADYSKIPGLYQLYQEFGDFHSNTEAAKRLWSKASGFAGGKAVIGSAYPIFKCPPSPLEAAFLFEELARKRGVRKNTEITFVTPFPRAYPAEPMNEIIEPIMKEKGISISTFFDVESVDTAKHVITSMEGDVLNYDFAALVPPHIGAGVVKDFCDENGFVKTDKETLQIDNFDDAYCIGDATNISTSKSGVTAHLESKVVAARLLGQDSKFDGRTNCPMEIGGHKCTFVIGSYTQPVARLKPSTTNYLMKLGMKYTAWQTLQTKMDWLMDWYFARTDPAKLNAKSSSSSQHQQSSNS
ncbi:MAG: NAD(P)/FAD-dependent oxidoreductase [Candidatus Micrarchaeia archaeon]